MAKLQPVVKSEIYLTNVAIVAGKARYHWSSYIYDDPNTDMKVAVTGFLTPTNNINNAQITGVDLGAQWFEVTHTTELAETAIALARAGTTTNATCKNITKPLPSQSLVLSHNRNGCTFSGKNQNPRTSPSELDKIWHDIIPIGIAKRRRLILKTLSETWGTVLTGGQRTAWAALGASITFTNYKGKTITPSGQQMFTATNAADLWRFGIIPYGDTNSAFPLLLDPPSPWAPPVPPSLGNIHLDNDNFSLAFETELLANPDWTPGLFGIHIGAITDPTKQRGPYIDSYGSISNFVDDHLLWSIPINYPFFRYGNIRPFTVALRWVDQNLHTFSDPQWIAVS